VLIESVREEFGRLLVEMGRERGDLVVVDADVSISTKTALFAKIFPERFIQVGISEQDLVSTAAGLALGGLTPVVCTFAAFLMRGWEQIRNIIARARLNVKIVGTHSGLSDYFDGSSHQCFEDIGLMRILPNVTVVSPADALSLRKLFRKSVELKVPVYLRLGRDHNFKIYEDENSVKLGEISILEDGKDAVMISTGAMVGVALLASKILKRKGYSVGVADVHTIKPLDEYTLIKLAQKTGLLFTLEDHNIYCGLGSAVAELLSEKYPVPVIRMGLRDKFGRSSLNFFKLLDYVGLSPRRVAEKVEGVLNGV